MQSREGIRICPVCNTSMSKTKRECVNKDCRVSLKSAEKAASGTDRHPGESTAQQTSVDDVKNKTSILNRITIVKGLNPGVISKG